MFLLDSPEMVDEPRGFPYQISTFNTLRLPTEACQRVENLLAPISRGASGIEIPVT